MKYSLFLTFFTFLSLNLSAQSQVIKSCETSIEYMGNSIDLNAKVFEEDGSLKGVITSRGQNQELTYKDIEIAEYPVQEGITGDEIDVDSDNDTFEAFNPGEQTISFSMQIIKLSQDTDETKPLSAGFDLSKVRSVKTYEFIDPSVNIGGTVIVEGYDKDNTYLGSFFTGFFVSACK